MSSARIENPQNLLPRAGRRQLAANSTIGEQFRNRRQGPQMKLVILARHQKQNHEMYWRIVQCLEINPTRGTPHHRHHLLQSVRKRMRNRHPGADSGADLILAGLERGQCLLPQRRGEKAGFHKVIHQFGDGRPVFDRLHVEDDLVRAEQFGQLHKADRIPQILAVGASGYRLKTLLASGFRCPEGA